MMGALLGFIGGWLMAEGFRHGDRGLFFVGITIFGSGLVAEWVLP